MQLVKQKVAYEYIVSRIYRCKNFSQYMLLTNHLLVNCAGNMMLELLTKNSSRDKLLCSELLIKPNNMEIVCVCGGGGGGGGGNCTTVFIWL